jgi:hypothetical protein
VGFIGDDQVIKPDIELAESIHHARVGGDINARSLVDGIGLADHTTRLTGQKFLKCFIRLNAQFFSITQRNLASATPVLAYVDVILRHDYWHNDRGNALKKA